MTAEPKKSAAEASEARTDAIRGTQPEPRSVPGMDPFEEPFWSYLMLMAWVITRDPETVNLAGDHARDRETYDKEIITPTGHRMVECDVEIPRNEAWLESRMVSNYTKEGGSLPRQTLQGAADAILHELQQGTLQMNAWRDSPRTLEIFPTEAWAHLRMREGSNLDHEAVLLGGAGTKWIRPRFRREAILELWPSEQNSDDNSSTQAAAPRAAGKRGRPINRGGYQKDDRPLVSRMKSLLDTGKVTSIAAAAKEVASDGKGASFDAIVKRLSRRFGEQHRQFR